MQLSVRTAVRWIPGIVDSRDPGSQRTSRQESDTSPACARESEERGQQAERPIPLQQGMPQVGTLPMMAATPCSTRTSTSKDGRSRPMPALTGS